MDVSISALASLVGYPVGITSSVVGLKICALIAGIKKYESMIKKKRKKHDSVISKSKVKYCQSLNF